MLPLRRDQAAYADNLQRLSGISRNGLELIHVDAQSNYMHLVPVSRIAVLHQLASAKVADAKDKLRPCNLAGKIAVVNFVEFLGPMDRERVVELPDLCSHHRNRSYRTTEVDMEMVKITLLHPVTKKKCLDCVKERVNFTMQVPATHRERGSHAAKEHVRVSEGKGYQYVNSFPDSCALQAIGAGSFLSFKRR
jgi:hypothetical protein